MTSSARRRLVRLGVIAALAGLTACAGERAHREGIEALEQGQWETGLARLEKATREAPGNVKYRADLRNRREQVLNEQLARADALRAEGKVAESEAAYRRILRLDRDNARARAALSALARDRRNAELLRDASELSKKGDLEGAQQRLRSLLLNDPHYAAARAMMEEIEERASRNVTAVPRLKTQGQKLVSLQFRDAPVKMVFEALSRMSGINFILDKDVKNDLRATIFVQQVHVGDAIDLILSQNQLAGKVLSENTLFVYPNTPAKLKDYQDQIVKTFYLTNIDAKQAMNMLKSVLNAKVTFVDEKSNVLIVRDAPEVVRMADKLVASLDLPEPEVMMEVEVLEVRRSRLMQLGIDYPDQVKLSLLRGTNPDTLTLEDFDHINPSRVGVDPLSISIDLKKEDADTNVLASPRIRARNREKAKILIGDRVPVITNTVTPTTTGTSVVTGNVSYLDVGLKLDVEPAVHLDDDVAIKVNLEVSSITREIVTASGTLAYQIGTRNASTLLRLKDGETQILAGLINDEERRAASKIPGLGDLPVLGRLFGTQRDDDQKTEIVLSITPRLIRNLQRPDGRIVEFWYGTESTLRSQSLVSGAPNGEPATAPEAPHTEGVPSRGDAPAPGAWQGPALVKVNEQFELTLSGEPKAAPIRLTFDAQALQLLAVEKAGAEVDHRQAQAGEVVIDLSQQAGAAGEAPLRFTFKALAARPGTVVTLTGAAGHTLSIGE